MPEQRYKDIVVTWPDEDQIVSLRVISDKPGEAEDITDLIAPMIDIYIEQTELLDKIEGKAYAEVEYPDDLEVYHNGEPIGLERAHEAFEVGFNHCIKVGLEALQKET